MGGKGRTCVELTLLPKLIQFDHRQLPLAVASCLQNLKSDMSMNEHDWDKIMN